MLVEKEIIRPGQYFYRDQKTGAPRKLDVTPALTHYWHEQGGKMLAAGLTVPVPCEHDFDAHPMSPADKLLNNAGWVKEYRLKGDALFGVLDVQDEELARKLPRTVRWTSPWINTFTDGQGKTWNNVISHLALTTRPRIVNQAPFGSIAAALSMAVEVKPAQQRADGSWMSIGVGSDGIALQAEKSSGGFCLSRAGRLVRQKSNKRVRPLYPIAFSLFSGAALGPGDMAPPKAKGKKPPPAAGAAPPPPDEDVDDDGDDDLDVGGDAEGDDESMIDLEPLGDPAGDVSMEELLCDLLGALGIHCEHSGDPEQFKRELYNAAMTKIHDLTGKADPNQPEKGQPNRTNPPGQPPNNPKSTGAPGGQPNPLIQQEQQPMYMSLDEINKLPDPMRGVALAMYNENVKLRGELDATVKVSASLQAAKLAEASAKRSGRVAMLGKLSPRVKADLDAMLAMPGMALSLGDGGAVVDLMAQTLAVLEKGLADMPRLLTTPSDQLFTNPQPTDGDLLSVEQEDKIADDMARAMGCPPIAKAG